MVEPWEATTSTINAIHFEVRVKKRSEIKVETVFFLETRNGHRFQQGSVGGVKFNN